MRYIVGILLLATAGFLVPTCVLAQSQMQDVERAILVATINHFEGELKDAGSLTGTSPTFIVSPAVLQRRGQRDEAGPERLWDAQDLAGVAATVGGQVGRLGTHRECSPGPVVAKCVLKGADAVFRFGKPEVNGTTATVEVSMVHRSEAAPDPLEAFSVHTVLELSCDEGEWTVTGVRRSVVG